MKINITKGIDLIFRNPNIEDNFAIEGKKNKHYYVYFKLEIEGYDKSYYTIFRWEFYNLIFLTDQYMPNLINSIDYSFKVHPLFLIKEWNWDLVKNKILNKVKKIPTPPTLSIENISRYLLNVDALFNLLYRDNAFWHFYLSNKKGLLPKITFSHAYKGSKLKYDDLFRIDSLKNYVPVRKDHFNLYFCFDIKLPNKSTKKGYITITTPSKFKEEYQVEFNSSPALMKATYKTIFLKEYDPKGIIDIINIYIKQEIVSFREEADLLVAISRIFDIE